MSTAGLDLDRMLDVVWVRSQFPSLGTQIDGQTDTDAGVVMIGDCAMKYDNVARHPLGIAESLLEGATAYKRIRQEASIFLPLYDPEVLVRYPSGIPALLGVEVDSEDLSADLVFR
jgi:hypothetical protein